MYAAVDLGSNSFRLHVGQHDGESIRVVKSMREPIRLAAGLDADGNLTEAAQQAALNCLRNFRVTLAGCRLEGVRVVATSAMRVAKNSVAFLPAAEEAIGYPIEIISGEEEGRLIYMGVANALAQPAERRLVIDIGGGSTELILGRGQDIERVESFSIGTVKQSLSFFVGGRIDAKSFEAAILSARSHFEDGAPPYYPQYWKACYGSSGTARTIGEIIFKNGLGKEVNAASLEALKNRFHRDRPRQPDRHAGPAPGSRLDHHRRAGDSDRPGARTGYSFGDADRGRPAHGRDVGPVSALDQARSPRAVGAQLPGEVPRRCGARPARGRRCGGAVRF